MILTLWYSTQRQRGKWIAISYANWQTAHSFWQTNILSSSSPLLGWDGMWGRFPELGNKSHLSWLAFSSKYQLFSIWQHFVREYYYQKAIVLTNMYNHHMLLGKCHIFKQISVSFLLVAFVREDYKKDIFPMVSGTDQPENSWCGRKKIRGFQTRNSQLVQRLVSRNRNIRTSKVFPLQLLVTQLMLWIWHKKY